MTKMNVVKVTSGVALAGALFWAAKALSATDNVVLECIPRHVAEEYPDLARSVSKICGLNDVDAVAVQTVLAHLEELHDLDQSVGMSSAQWKISRLCPKIVASCKQVCSTAKVHTNEHMRELVYVQEDVLPQVEGCLENILHNFMLK